MQIREMENRKKDEQKMYELALAKKDLFTIHRLPFTCSKGASMIEMISQKEGAKRTLFAE